MGAKLTKLVKKRIEIERQIEEETIFIAKKEMDTIIKKNPESLIVLTRTPVGFTISLVGMFNREYNLQNKLEKMGIFNVTFDLCTNLSQVEGETIFRLRGTECRL